jgi:hypothetical protein
MNPIRTRHTLITLGATKGWDAERHGPCEGLPVAHGDGVFYSCWKLSWRERDAILFGRPVRLCVTGVTRPAVMLDTEI